MSNSRVKYRFLDLKFSSSFALATSAVSLVVLGCPAGPRRCARSRYRKSWVAGTLYFLFFLFKLIYLFLAVLGLRFCARTFSSCSERGPLFIAVRGPPTIAAALVAEHRLQTRRLSSCGSRA